MRALTFAAIAAIAVAGCAAAQTDADAPQVAVEDLGDGLYMLIGRGGNVGLSVGDDGAFLIDDQYAPMTPAIAAAVAQLNDGDAAVRFVINTHYHGDHTGGNEAWAERGATVFAHDNVLVRHMAPPVSTVSNAPQAAVSPSHWPTVTFAQGVSFHLNGEVARVIHVPAAHTDGDAIVWFERANVLHMGDAFFNGLLPYIDINAGGSVDGFIAAQDLGLSLANDDTKIIPGHGPLATKADLQTMRDLLVDVRGLVAAQIEAGLTLEQAVAANPLSAYDESHGRVFITTDKMVEIVYTDLVARAAD